MFLKVFGVLSFIAVAAANEKVNDLHIITKLKLMLCLAILINICNIAFNTKPSESDSYSYNNEIMYEIKEAL